jgi:hypothetical protein
MRTRLGRALALSSLALCLLHWPSAASAQETPVSSEVFTWHPQVALDTSEAGLELRAHLAAARASHERMVSCVRRLMRGIQRRLAGDLSDEERVRLESLVARVEAALPIAHERFRHQLENAEHERVDALVICGRRHAEAIRVERGGLRVDMDGDDAVDITDAVVAAMSSAGCAAETSVAAPIETAHEDWAPRECEAR